MPLEAGKLALLAQPLPSSRITYSIVGLQTLDQPEATRRGRPAERTLEKGIVLRWERGANGTKFFIIRYTTQPLRQVQEQPQGGTLKPTVSVPDPTFERFLRSYALGLLPSWMAFEAAILSTTRNREITDDRLRDGIASVNPQFWHDIQGQLPRMRGKFTLRGGRAGSAPRPPTRWR